jgi:signal transduction histidine kinase
MTVNLSHELRTPLNGIIGSLQLILDGTIEEPQEQLSFIQDAYSSALHLFKIVKDLLDISQIAAGKMELALDSIRVDELLIHVQKSTQAKVEHKQLSFSINQPEIYKDVIVYGNYQRLLQVILNLVGNAIKFTNVGGLTINLEIIKQPLNFRDQQFPGLVQFQIVDTGIGMPLEEQDHLLSSINQADVYCNCRNGDSGLGLSISQKLVELMGGTMNFYSPGKDLGFTVSFTVPLYCCIELF